MKLPITAHSPPDKYKADNKRLQTTTNAYTWFSCISW